MLEKPRNIFEAPLDPVALEADGVLVDYPFGYAEAWMRAFGERISVVNPTAYHATNRYGVKFESEAQMLHFFSHFTADIWESLPALPGAVEACEKLASAGHPLVCVTAMDREFARARHGNLLKHKFPIKQVYATGRNDLGFSKLPALQALKPIALVDNLALNFAGLDSSVHKAFIFTNAPDEPDHQLDIHKPDSTHGTLLDFANYWLTRKQRITAS